MYLLLWVAYYFTISDNIILIPTLLLYLYWLHYIVYLTATMMAI